MSQITISAPYDSKGAEALKRLVEKTGQTRVMKCRSTFEEWKMSPESTCCGVIRSSKRTPVLVKITLGNNDGDVVLRPMPGQSFSIKGRGDQIVVRVGNDISEGRLHQLAGGLMVAIAKKWSQSVDIAPRIERRHPRKGCGWTKADALSR